MPNMIYVDSSNIEAIGYVDDTQELYVRFLNRETYVYSEVPREIFDAMLIAPSKGSFLNRVIKGVYHYTKS